MNIIHGDARAFLNTTNSSYDVIFSDAFGSYYSIPYQLTTKEAIQKKYDILHDDGVVLSNLIT
jgi:spermidine synthase